MPFLDAKALDNDPDGMVFLRSVIRPNFEKEEAASLRGDAPLRSDAVSVQFSAETLDTPTAQVKAAGPAPAMP